MARVEFFRVSVCARVTCRQPYFFGADGEGSATPPGARQCRPRQEFSAQGTQAMELGKAASEDISETIFPGALSQRGNCTPRPLVPASAPPCDVGQRQVVSTTETKVRRV